jgi:hypothetical protein
MWTIRQRIKEAQEWQKSYADVHRIDHSYEVRDKVFLWLKLHKSSIKGAKLSPRFLGPFEVIEKEGTHLLSTSLTWFFGPYTRCVSCFSFMSLYFRSITCYWHDFIVGIWWGWCHSGTNPNTGPSHSTNTTLNSLVGQGPVRQL